MQKLIIIRGNSGSGKSTVAKKLQHEMGYQTMLIPQDVVRREILRVRDKPANPSIDLVYEMAMYGKRIGYDVIIEGIFINERYGDMLRRLIQDFKSETHVYYFDIPLEETLRRHATKPNSHDFGEKELRAWWIEKDYLQVSGETFIPTNMTENDIMTLFKRDLGIGTKRDDPNWIAS